MELMEIPSFMRKLLETPFKFWCCPNIEHKLVKWDEKGIQATCEECGEQSPVKGNEQG